MDIKYLEETINLSTIQWDDEKLSRYIFKQSYYPKVSNNIYNAIFSYYKNMNYSEKEYEYIDSLYTIKLNYDKYMERHEQSIKFIILMFTVLMYSYFLYKFLSSVMFVIIEVFYAVYDLLSYDDNMQTDNEIIAEDTLDNNIDTDDIDTNDIDTNDIDTNDIDTNDIDTNDIDTDPIENSKIENDIKTRVKYEDEDEEFEVYDIQTILEDIVFKNVTMKQLASRCNKKSIRIIRKFHNSKSLNKVQLIMAFMHTHIFRYYNSKTASIIYFSLYNYLNCKMESYGFKNASYSLYKNLTPDDIDKYINYYFDIAIIVDC